MNSQKAPHRRRTTLSGEGDVFDRRDSLLRGGSSVALRMHAAEGVVSEDST